MDKLNFYNFLKDVSFTTTLYKIYIISVLLLLGCIYNPFMFLAFLIAMSFVTFENSIKSIGFILAIYPFFNIFNIPNISLSCWHMLIIVFIFMQVINGFNKIYRKQHKLNLPIFSICAVLIIYLALPIYSNYYISVIAKSVLWIILGYILFEFRKELVFKDIILSFIFALIVSYCLSMLRCGIPYLQQSYFYFMAYDKIRFAGLMGNPNQFYQLIVIATFSLIYLIYTKRLKLIYSLLFLPLFIMGWLTLSRTFIIVLVMLLVLLLILCFIKFDKFNKKFLCIVLSVFFTTSIICLPYTICYFDRIESNTIQATPQEPPLNEDTKNETNELEGDLEVFDPSSILLDKTRTEIYEYYINQIKENNAWLFGVGLSTAYVQSYTVNAHNTIIQGIYSVGIIGILLIAILVILVLIKLFYGFAWNVKNCLIVSMGFLAIFACFMIENHFFTKLGFIQVFFAFLILIDYNNFNNLEKKHDNLHSQKNSLYLVGEK